MKALVTGGGGFLGKALVRLLVREGHEVVAFQRGAYPELEALGARAVAGDIGDPAALGEAARGCDTVFHVAAKAGVWGSPEEYRRSNVAGTAGVVETCRALGVRRLVYTSSPSAVFSGRDEEGIDESAPYPSRYLAPYPETKAEAERIVLAANSGSLATVALRPHLVWGPGDPHLVPRIVARARAGRLALVGGGAKKVDSTYIDNAALAHLRAAERLGPGALCAGRAYFISNGEPLPMGDLVNGILDAAGLPPVTRSVSPAAAFAAGWAMEKLYRLLGRREEPLMTRFVARQLSTAHWYDISAARRDLGYLPAVTVAEGLRRLSLSLRGEGP